MMSPGDALKGQTVLFFTFVLMEMLTVYVVRWRYGTDILSNKWLHLAVLSSIILQSAVIFGPLAPFFGAMPIGLGELEEIAGGLLGFLVLLGAALWLEPLLVAGHRFKNVVK